MTKPYVIRDWLGNYYLADEKELMFAGRTAKPIELYLEAMKEKTIVPLTADQVRERLPAGVERVMLYICRTDEERMINIKDL